MKHGKGRREGGRDGAGLPSNPSPGLVNARAQGKKLMAVEIASYCKSCEGGC